MKTSFAMFSDALARSTDLGDSSRLLSFEAGETIISAEEKDDRVYFILKGSVKITNFSVKGREIWHGTLGAGRTFGEVAALTGAKRNASVTALERTRIAVITRNELHTLLRDNSDFALWLLEDLAARLTQSTETVQNILTQSLPQRIRTEIYRLARASDQVDESGLPVIKPAPNLTEVAKRLNTEREIVSREVSALTKRNVLRKDKTQMIILDPEFFESAANDT